MAIIKHLGKTNQRPNLMNLKRVAKPPITGSNCALAQTSKHRLKFQGELTMFESILDAVQILKIRSQS